MLCVYWCVLLRSCRQRWTGRNTCRPAAAARLLPQEQQAGVQGRQARTFPPCCCCCNKHNERLRNAHFIRCPPLVRCSSLARPPSPTPHTRHTCILYIIYILCIYSSIPHTTIAAAAAASHHHPPRRRSRPTISAYYRIIRRHVIEYVGTWMEHHRSQREEKAVAAAAANVMYGRAIYT